MNTEELLNPNNGEILPAEQNNEFLAALYGDNKNLDSNLIPPMPFDEDVFLVGVTVAGTSYIDNIATVYNSLKVGDRVTLIREPENEFDKRAVIIETLKGEKIGYVPRQYNLIISRLMDSGYLLYGKVRLLEIISDRYNHIVVKIYMTCNSFGTRNYKLIQKDSDEEEIENSRKEFLREMKVSKNYDTKYLPGSAEYYYESAKKSIDSGSIEDADAAIRKALEIKPSNSQYHNFLGYLQSCEEKHDDAIKEFQKTVELDDKNACAFYNLGIEYFLKGNLDAVIEMASKAIELCPDESVSWGLRGMAFVDKLCKLPFGEREDFYKVADRDLKRAIELNPTSACFNQLYMANYVGYTGKCNVNMTDLGVCYSFDSKNNKRD